MAVQLLGLRPTIHVRPTVVPCKVNARRIAANAVKEDGRSSNVGDYCSIDQAGQGVDKSLGEKESDFIEALQNYYYDGTSKMTDEEFENLKEELLWSGSKVAVLNSTEQRFLEATMAYSRGQSIMSDTEFDALKVQLRSQNSVVTQAGPRCSIRSKRLYSDASPAYLKMTLLNLPGLLIVLGLLFSIDDLTGFEITKAIELPPPYNILFLWGLVLPTIYVFAASITNAVLPDALILKAACPNCGTVNQAYFGGIFNVAGNNVSATIECKNCLADNEFNVLKREVVITTSAEEKQRQAAERAEKLKAKAAKRKVKAKAET